MLLARAAGIEVVAHHVDHGHCERTATDADRARDIAAAVGVTFVVHRARIEPGANFEARARAARSELLPKDSATGHTADDLAETVLYRLMRGVGVDGLAAMRPGPQHPILALRRAETRQVCRWFGVDPIVDPSNDDPSFVRNRIRHELLPLMDDIAQRDVVPLIARTSHLADVQRRLLDQAAEEIDPCDVHQLQAVHPAIAQRALRRWVGGSSLHDYPPDAAAMERLMAVVRGDAVACELTGGIRVERSRQRLRIIEAKR